MRAVCFPADFDLDEKYPPPLASELIGIPNDDEWTRLAAVVNARLRPIANPGREFLPRGTKLFRQAA